MNAPPPLPAEIVTIRKRRSPIAPAIGIGLFGFIAVLIYYSVDDLLQQRAADAAAVNARNAAASNAGFADDDDLQRAKAQGFADPTAWRAKLANDKAASQKRAAELKAEYAEAIRPVTDRMELTDQSWAKGGFESIGIMSFTIKNKNSFSVKDILVACRFYAASGTLLTERTHTVYDVIPPAAVKRFTKVNVGFINTQSREAGCSLVGAFRK